jgi:antitoxin YefM
MPVKTTYTDARANLAKLWDEVENSREPAILERRGHESMALIPAEELSSLEETAYLLRSPNNAVRLLSALIRSRRQATRPVDLERLEQELGLARPA